MNNSNKISPRESGYREVYVRQLLFPGGDISIGRPTDDVKMSDEGRRKMTLQATAFP